MLKPVSISALHERMHESILPLGSEWIDLGDAFGRVLAEPIKAERPIPAFDRVMMDGIAVKYTGETSHWRLQSTQFAGDKPSKLSDGKSCIEVMTGAVLPFGCDTIIPVEDYALSDRRVTLLKDARLNPGQFIHSRGSDAGRGDQLMDAGELLDGRSLALAAANGGAKISVRKTPKTAFISTGDELVGLKDPLEISKIRRSNDRIVAGELAKFHIVMCENLHLGDDEPTILRRLIELEKTHDLIVFSGGVSKGKADYIFGCAKQAGFNIHAHGIFQKPGGPLLFATHPSGTVLLGLPGNPLSTTVCTRLHFRKVLNCLAGIPLQTEHVTLETIPKKLQKKARLIPGIKNELGKIEPVFANTSGDYISVIRTDGMFELPSVLESTRVEKNAKYRYWDWAK